jgi:hypothetical protein
LRSFVPGQEPCAHVSIGARREAAGHSLLAVRVEVVMVHQPNLRLGLKQTL